MPLFQSLIWPILVGFIVYWLRSEIREFILEMVSRLKSGDDFEVGKDGVKLRKHSAADVIDDSAVTNSNDFVVEKELERTPFIAPEGLVAESKIGLHLVHSAKRASDLDKKGYQYFRLRFWLDSESEADLDKVESVTYELHESFKNPVRTVSDRQTRFALKSAGWGEFMLRAVVRFKGRPGTVELQRYVNLPGTG